MNRQWGRYEDRAWLMVMGSLWAICAAWAQFVLAAQSPEATVTGPGILVAQASAGVPEGGGTSVSPPVDAHVSQSAASTAGIDGYTYSPSGRRDPFVPIVLESQARVAENLNLPPLQRVGFTELHLIGIAWGSFGYTAMVQTPDGKGYAVRRGTRIGPNNGVVIDVTDNSIVLQERFTDVYGKKQVREYVKLLHPKEASE